MRMVFSDDEIAYLSMPWPGGRLGRLATVGASGAPQVMPVGVVFDPSAPRIDIRGADLASTVKYRNVGTNPWVALVIDDVASVDPWWVRGVQIRGVAEIVVEPRPSEPARPRELIRIHPRRVVSWGLGPDGTSNSRRTVRPTVLAAPVGGMMSADSAYPTPTELR